MPRLAPPPKPQLGRRLLFFRYDPSFIAKLKQVPGASWDPDRRAWWVPEELSNALLAEAAKHRLGPSLSEPNRKPSGRKIESFSYRGRALKDFQIESVNRALASGRYLFGHEMGVGKSPCALAVLSATGAKFPLIVTYASIRTTWEDHVHEWTSRAVAILETGKQALDYVPDEYAVTICSYELLSTLGHPEAFDAVVFDECHALKNPKSERNKYATALLALDKAPIVLGLSGTLIPNRFSDIHGVLDLFWPGRFGSSFKFKSRYGIPEESEYSTSGQVFRHLNPLHEKELAARLAAVSHRVTLAEVAKDLPPFYITVDQRRCSSALKASSKKFARARDELKFEGLLLEAFAAKAEWAAEVVADHLDENVSHIALITHLKTSAKQLAEMSKKLFKGYEVFHIDGDVPASKRLAVISLAAEAEKAIVCCTMHSIGTGINKFADFDLAVFAELDYQPKEVIQTLGRFNRMNSTRASKCILLSFLGTLDERVALSVLDKVKEANRLSSAGAGESALEKSLSGEDQSEEDFFSSLCDALLMEDE